MRTYAQLNEDLVCIAITQTEGIIDNPNVVEIGYFDMGLLGLRYNEGAWEPIESEPETPQEFTPNPLEAISEQLKALSEKYENDQSYTQEMMLTLASAVAEVYERLDAEALK